MPLSLTTEVRMIKGVGPHRAELLPNPAIYTVDHPLPSIDAHLLLAQQETVSTDVGAIVPTYQAVGTFAALSILPTIHTALQPPVPRMPDVFPEDLRARLAYPARFQALAQTHF